ncbi:MAG: RcpC/CpaB family pilus assembly protein [Acidimicrobiia bacterium]|nr:RcpC/CpaB family pilus assembly protein [Acidimicrobiia bacterium]
MNSRRTVILIVAVVVGAIAAFGLLNYIRNVEGSVYDNAEPETVWVVRLPIEKGTTSEQALALNMIYETEIPATFRPATAIVDPNTELAGLVAVTDLPVNAPLVTGNFVPSNVVNTGITDRLEEKELVTVTFSVDQVKGAAYLIEPGDFVNLLSVKQIVESGDEDGEPTADEPVDLGSGLVALPVNGSASYDYIARYVYQRAEVLAIDKALTPDLGESSEQAEGAPRNAGMITLAVPPDAVQTILSVGMENIYLSLVPSTYAPDPLPPIDYGNEVYPAEDADRLTPYGPKGGDVDPE